MNIFSTTLFLETAGALFFAKRRRSIELFRLENHVLRLLVLDGRTVVRAMPFYDFPQPVTDGADGPLKPLSYFPRTVVETTSVDQPMPHAPGFQPSPYVEWAAFADWPSYERFVERKPLAKQGDSKRQRRKIERDLGPMKFLFDDQRPEVFDAVVRWKSAQYLATGVGDMFAKPENVELFQRLKHQRALVVSSLSAGPTLLAAHFGSLHDRRLSWWVPAYDPAYSKYSPGRLMLEELMRESHRLRHLEFDFLIGDEAYKFNYATHNRVIGPMGTPSLREQLFERAKKEGKALLARNPMAYQWARAIKRRLRRS